MKDQEITYYMVSYNMFHPLLAELGLGFQINLKNSTVANKLSKLFFGVQKIFRVV